MTRLSIVALSVAVFAGAAACGGLAKTAGGTKQGATTQPTSAGSAITSQPASAAAVVSVTTTEGFVYKVQALPPKCEGQSEGG